MNELDLFVASSSEGRRTARDLRDRLPRTWRVRLWDEGTMLPGHSAWESLIHIGQTVDFAVMLITADDVIEHRGEKHLAPRDNVVFECGLFMGMIGPDRTVLVQERQLDVRLPTDLAGMTRVHYDRPTSTHDERDAVDAAAREIERSAARLGRRMHDVPPAADHRQALADELEKLCAAATSHGWELVTDTKSILCLRHVGRRAIKVRVPRGDPELSRRELRHAALALQKLGVRVAQDLLPPSAQRNQRDS
ncbi:MAG: nucleotide-binding protein [Actinomycetota bacterium]|nr:nucleotide-binding protein [Actinomycetota bacterium]